jgi:rare lipoprotein A
MSEPRIVSLVPSLTELICELGLTNRLVGRTGFCVHPKAIAHVPKVGGTKTVNIERIRRLAPTHLIVNIDENEKPTVDELARFVPNIIVTHPIGVEDNFGLYRQFGEVFNVHGAANQLCDRLADVLARVDDAYRESIPVAYLIWNDPWMTVGPDTFIARMLERVALMARAPETGARYPTVDPDWLAASGVQAVLLSSEPCRFRVADRAQLRAAWRSRGEPSPAVLGIDGEMTSWYGPRAITGLEYLLRYRARLERRLERRPERRPGARSSLSSDPTPSVAQTALGPSVEAKAWAPGLGSVSAVLLALSLAGCAAPSGVSDSVSDSLASAPGASASSAGQAPTGGRGGRFYLDDGPGDRPLAELEKIPDAEPRSEPLHRFANRPYTQFGRYYEPMTRLEPFKERGVATWYGRRYHNRPTSTGERYDMYAMTAAHPTLPLPSYARVTNLRSGRSVIVRVNDRGPFVPGRVIDLSYAAAARLGTALPGSGEVEVELITKFDRPANPALASSPARANTAPVVAGPSPSVAVQAIPVVAATVPALEVARDPAPSSVSGPAAGGTVVATEPNATAATTPATAAAGAPVSPTAGTPPGATAGQGGAGLAPGRYVQVGAYQTRAGAQAALERLSARPGGLPEAVAVRQDGALFKLLAGPYPQPNQALDALRRLRAATGVDVFQLIR